jgi:quercetin dioxygenase-like cupin family protein
MNEPVNFREKIEATKKKGPWIPLDVDIVNNHRVSFMLYKGEHVWHKHDNGDVLLLVYKGKVTVQFKDHPNVVLHNCESFTIPKGVMHCSKSEGDSYVILFQPIHLNINLK